MHQDPSLPQGHPYPTPLAHLRDEQRRIQLWLQRKELSRHGEADGVTQQLDALTQLIESRLADNERAGQPLPLTRLSRSLALSSLEVSLLTVLLLAETVPEARAQLSPHFPSGTVQGTVANYLDLLSHDETTQRTLLWALSPSGTLRRHGLIFLAPDPAWAPTTPLLFQRVKLSDRLAAFLHGEERPPTHALPHGVSLYIGQKTLAQLTLPTGIADKLRDALDECTQPLLSDSDGSVLPPLCVTGLRRSGRKAILSALLPGRPLVVLSASSLLRGEAALIQTVQAALAEAAIVQGVLYIASAELLGELESALFEQLRRLLLGSRVRVVLAADGPIDTLWTRLPELLRVDIPMPDRATQIALWNHLLPVDMLRERGFDVRSLASSYSLPSGAIQRCVSEMVRSARIDGSKQPTLTMAAAREAVRKQLGNRFGDLAQLVSISLSWEDLVLPPESMERVLEIVAYARYREQLLGKWGFERKLPYGRSISVLLAGAPGTGKTMVAALVAKEIGLELFRVNVARVVERFAGETEKNLARIFDEAKRQQVALLFDEADTLFGRRLDVRSSQDRYANMAVSYLLQAVESHDGVLILTTNNEKLLDDAFRRRLRFRIGLPLPSETERARLWESMLPKDTPLADGIDFLQLAQEFDLSGGAIKNAVVRAALRALAQGSAVTIDLLRRCAKLECEEMGILVATESDEEPSDLDEESDDEDDSPASADATGRSDIHRTSRQPEAGSTSRPRRAD